MKKQRKHYTPEEKVAILRHLLDKEPISKLCDELRLQTTVFYRWQKEFFENEAAAFEQKRPANHSAEQERIAYLEKKIQSRQTRGSVWRINIFPPLEPEPWVSLKLEHSGASRIPFGRRG